MSLIGRKDCDLAGFVFKGQLADVALEAVVKPKRNSGQLELADIKRKVSIDILDSDAVAAATRMSGVYIAIASFENMVRDLIANRLFEEKGADWWDKHVNADIRKRAEKKIEDEERIRWHKSRGLSPIFFTELKDLISIIHGNWESFEDLLPDIEWVRHIIRTVERSRNVIMHSGQLSLEDVERVGMIMRDWIRQVGS